MFRLKDVRDKMDKAIQRAKELHPTVRFTDRFGVYTCTGSTANIYEVTCYRDPEGEPTVDCSCPTRPGTVCKHAVAVLPLHVYTAAQLSRLADEVSA